MKKFFGFNKLLASVAVLASVMIFQSCLDDDDKNSVIMLLVMYMVNLPTDWWHLIWIPCLTLKEKQ